MGFECPPPSKKNASQDYPCYNTDILAEDYEVEFDGASRAGKPACTCALVLFEWAFVDRSLRSASFFLVPLT